MTEIFQEKTQKHPFLFFVLLFVSILSGVIVFTATTNGPMGYSDSVAYIVSARNLLKGIGLGMFTPGGRFVLTYLHPPLYPLVLSGMGVFGGDLVSVARWCNVILSALTVFLSGYVFLRHSGFPELAIVASVLTFMFPTVLAMFTSAMSEALFLFLVSLSLLLLLNYLAKPTTLGFISAALVCGLLPVTRYVGAAVIVAATVCIFLFSTGSWQERLKRTVVFGLLAVLPLLLWFTVLSFGTSHALGGRSVQVNGAQLMAGIAAYRKAAIEILWGWIPYSKRSLFQFVTPVRGWIMGIGFLVICAVSWLAGRSLLQKGNERGKADVHISVFSGVAVFSYFFTFMATWLFTVPQTPINDRLLMPIYSLALPGLLSCLTIWLGAWRVPARKFIRVVPWLLALLMGYWYFPQVLDVIEEARKNDTALAYRWQDSQIMRALDELPDEQQIISNKSETVVLWADRPAYDLMENISINFVRQNTPYGFDETDAAQNAFRQGAVLVIFNDFTNQFEATYGPRGKERLATIFDSLTVAGQYPEGTIYIYSSK